MQYAEEQLSAFAARGAARRPKILIGAALFVAGAVLGILGASGEREGLFGVPWAVVMLLSIAIWAVGFGLWIWNIRCPACGKMLFVPLGSPFCPWCGVKCRK